MHQAKSLAIVALLMISISSARAQVINQTVPTPSSAEATLSAPSVRAGETVSLTITLDAAFPTAVILDGNFQANGDYFQVNVGFAAGAVASTVAVVVPSNADGGDYVLSGLIYRGDKRPMNIPISPIPVHVQPLPKAVKLLPSKATGELDLDQKQYIRMQASQLITLRDSFVAEANHDAASTPALRTKVISMLSQADDLLPLTRDKYISLYKQQPILSPVMFEDFHRSYQAALIELRAAGLLSQSIPRAHFLDVQLSQRAPALQESKRDWENHTLKGTYPLYAMAALNLLEENIEAYLLIGETGVDTFSIRLASIPSGATISYKRIGEDYQILSKPTDVPSTTFPYAMWTFKFEKVGCRTTERTPNPYIELHPDLTVELSCKSK